jgi:hypothetical protein
VIRQRTRATRRRAQIGVRGREAALVWIHKDSYAPTLLRLFVNGSLDRRWFATHTTTPPSSPAAAVPQARLRDAATATALRRRAGSVAASWRWASFGRLFFIGEILVEATRKPDETLKTLWNTAQLRNACRRGLVDTLAIRGLDYASRPCDHLTAYKVAASSGTMRLSDLSAVAPQLDVTGSKAHTAGFAPG